MIYVFEDHNALDLEPLTLTRATFELRCGVFTHLERIRRVVGNQPLALVVRPELAAVMQESYPDLSVNPKQVEAGLWLNGAALWNEAAWEQLGGVSGTPVIAIRRLTDLSRPCVGIEGLAEGTCPAGRSPKGEPELAQGCLWDDLSIC